MAKNQRTCIYPKDISILLGKSYKQAVRISGTIRDAYGKKSHQYLTLEEFSEYTGIDIAAVKKVCQ
ncbi:hypothetical protein ORI89_05355 [Sphingobacterium sp. UT-1RO-CII-1]|uniref:hypothetical protein n=1 Tax=Sphingobacterium sp. UT-1RO-CII-1 TaxID=2995225 RepID=UPI00227B2EDE|nr:hypothetical protein [Sphingobacterium sp. UT-1RO-CII-1]MCY4779066.1 hypothetical protein [Sphingobacterium sp. UT-1RO-CII-1]